MFEKLQRISYFEIAMSKPLFGLWFKLVLTFSKNFAQGSTMSIRSNKPASKHFEMRPMPAPQSATVSWDDRLRDSCKTYL